MCAACPRISGKGERERGVEGWGAAVSRYNSSDQFMNEMLVYDTLICISK